VPVRLQGKGLDLSRLDTGGGRLRRYQQTVANEIGLAAVCPCEDAEYKEGCETSLFMLNRNILQGPGAVQGSMGADAHACGTCRSSHAHARACSISLSHAAL
jgi:hypothetical protein